MFIKVLRGAGTSSYGSIDRHCKFKPQPNPTPNPKPHLLSEFIPRRIFPLASRWELLGMEVGKQSLRVLWHSESALQRSSAFTGGLMPTSSGLSQSAGFLVQSLSSLSKIDDLQSLRSLTLWSKRTTLTCHRRASTGLTMRTKRRNCLCEDKNVVLTLMQCQGEYSRDSEG